MYIPQAIQNKLSNLVSSHGWQKGLDLFIRGASPEYVQAILNEIRLRPTAWVGLLNIKEINTAYVLDFSLGATAVTLARFVENVNFVFQEMRISVQLFIQKENQP